MTSHKNDPDAGYRFFALLISIPLLLVIWAMVFPRFFPLSQEVLPRLAVGYGTILLGFFIGARIGGSLGKADGYLERSLASVLGLGMGLVILLLDISPALAVLITGIGGLGAWDSWSGFKGVLPRPYARMRMRATMLVCLALIIILILHGVSVPLIAPFPSST